MSNETSRSDMSLDENLRRYYLDTMGIQSWALRDDNHLPDAMPFSDAGEMSQPVDEYAGWRKVDDSITGCNRCPLHKSRKQAITGRGNQAARLMFVLLSPVASDDESGMLCSGEAYQLFSKMLSAIDIVINDVYITSLLKCVVPTTHTITPKEVKSCHDHLQQQIDLVKPEHIIILGETTIRCLLQENLSIDDYRAMNSQQQNLLASIPVFVSYSPHELLQTPVLKRKAWQDLQQLQHLIKV